MKAIILAAGEGTRLKKYTQDLPKGMLDFMGKTVIQRQIELYRSQGIEDIIIIKGFAGHKINYQDIKYYTNEEYRETNMVESLLKAKEEFDTDIIVSYSDILFTEEILGEMIKTKGDYLVAVDNNWKDYWQMRYARIDFDTESLKLDENDNILSLGKEDPGLDQIDARYIGILKFSKDGLENIVKLIERDYEAYQDKSWKQSGKTIKKAYMTDLLQALIEDEREVKAVRFNNGWIEFDTNEDYEKACKWAEDGSLSRVIKI